MSAFASELEIPLKPLVKTLIENGNCNKNLEFCIDLTLESLLKLKDVLPPHVFKVAIVLQENIPADINPIGNSVLLQMLIMGNSFNFNSNFYFKFFFF